MYGYMRLDDELTEESLNNLIKKLSNCVSKGLMEYINDESSLDDLDFKITDKQGNVYTLIFGIREWDCNYNNCGDVE